MQGLVQNNLSIIISSIKALIIKIHNQFLHSSFLFLLLFDFNKIMSKGFAYNTTKSLKTKKLTAPNEPQGRLISWSPWPPANFQKRYPAFPFVLTILIIVIGQWYLSLLR